MQRKNSKPVTGELTLKLSEIVESGGFYQNQNAKKTLERLKNLQEKKMKYVVVAKCYWNLEETVLLFFEDGKITSAYDRPENRNVKITSMTLEEAERLVETHKRDLNLYMNSKNLLRFVGEPKIMLENEYLDPDILNNITTEEFKKYVNCALEHMREQTASPIKHFNTLLVSLWGDKGV